MGLMDAPKEPNERIIASCAAYACAWPAATAVCCWMAAACACAAAAAAAAKPEFMLAIPAAAAIAWKFAKLGTAAAAADAADALADVRPALLDGLFSRAVRPVSLAFCSAGDAGMLSSPPARLYLWCPFGFFGMGTRRGRPRGKPFSDRGGPSNSALNSAAVTLVLSSSSWTMIQVLACRVGSFLRKSFWMVMGSSTVRLHVAMRTSSMKN
mmetsp:Transcript_2881/g.12982  ORF Transcript_2881/g.12982 Transcript_2881/m.12982 type:complete len:211 (-) Transcript_2881:1082-1714(-)